MLKVGILSSSKGTDLPALFSAQLKGVEFSCLITNKKNSGSREKAKNFNIQDYYIEEEDSEAFEKKVIAILESHQVDLVLLIGFMKILSPLLLRNFSDAVLNIHPSILPAFVGDKNLSIHEAVFQRGCKLTGATIHFVNENVDAGPILMQKSVSINHKDTPETIKKKVQKLEQKMLIKSVELFRDHKIKIVDSKVIVDI